MSPRQCKQIEVEPVDPEPLEAALARGDRPSAGRRCAGRPSRRRRSRRAALDRLSNDLLAAAVRVHLGGVDQREAEVEAVAQRRDLGLAPLGRSPIFHVPRPSAGTGRPSASATRRMLDIAQA
jgi:hypothetical protein